MKKQMEDLRRIRSANVSIQFGQTIRSMINVKKSFIHTDCVDSDLRAFSQAGKNLHQSQNPFRWFMRTTAQTI